MPVLSRTEFWAEITRRRVGPEGVSEYEAERLGAQLDLDMLLQRELSEGEVRKWIDGVLMESNSVPDQNLINLWLVALASRNRSRADEIQEVFEVRWGIAPPDSP